MFRPTLALAAVVALSACMTDEIPLTVAAPNADSVSVRVDGSSVEFLPESEKAGVFARADTQARKTCQANGRNEAVFNTSQNVPTSEGFDIERLYLCLT